MIDKIKVFLGDNEQSAKHNMFCENCHWRPCPGYKKDIEVFWEKVTTMNEDPTIAKMQQRFED